MKIVQQSVEVLVFPQGTELYKLIELAARTCYKSEDRITDESSLAMLNMLQDRNHSAMLEHSFISMRFVCNRGVSHEIVRHRLFSYAQESTRYCNYSKDKFGNQITYIDPSYMIDLLEVSDEVKSLTLATWAASCLMDEEQYFKMVNELKIPPQVAREVLNNALKTEIVISGNVREWMHFFNLRTSKDAHPMMRQVAKMALVIARERAPEIFNNCGNVEDK